MSYLVLTLSIAFNCLCNGVFSENYNVSTEEPRLTTTLGPIKGRSVNFRGSTIYQFLNIPYGEPPIGELRFQKPIARSPWSQEVATDKWGTHCPQPPLPSINDGIIIDEDCLSLNVFTTRTAFLEADHEEKLRPVMVWIHGGGFIFGSAHQYNHYDGTALVGLKDVVLVSINYRVGPLGFLHLPEVGVPGNMGLWDQLLAFEWVQENIKSFGGDPNQVTIFGESAGSVSVSAHIVSPLTRGLFKNAIMQSGSIFDIPRWTIKEVGELFLKEIGCKSTEKRDCLSAYEPRKSMLADTMLFWPVHGDEFLPLEPEKLLNQTSFDKEINVMLGTVGNEGAVLTLLRDVSAFNPMLPPVLDLSKARHYLIEMFGRSTLPFYIENYLNETSANFLPKVAQALGDTMIGCPTYAFGRSLIEAGLASKVFAYHQTQKPTSKNLIGFASNIPWMPASHCNDIPMIFGQPFLQPASHKVEDALLSTLMMDAWVNFARTGKPSTIGQSNWPSWQNESDRPTMVLDGKRIGVLDSTQSDFCLNNWPFPREEGRYWSQKIGPYNANAHDEF